MKKLIIAAVVLVSMSIQAFALTITINTKSQWNGSACAEATKGLCIRMDLLSTPSSTSFNGNIAYDRSQGLILTFSKSKDLTRTTYSAYFNEGSFLVDGDSSIPADVLKGINYPYTSMTIKQGKYQYSVDGDIITVVIPTNNTLSK
jgi:hypothetical protein